jgi:nucleoside-diphosphate-sugar epimerase
MPSCIIFGGSGYIGTKLAEYFLERKRFDRVYIADIKESPLQNKEGVISGIIDVRKPISISFVEKPIEWIFNLAAIHREPGHESHEYFETNIKGAENISDFAENIGCRNIFFTASISTYGPTYTAMNEYMLTMPNTPYGISKLSAEYIHKVWVEKEKERRLIIVRPGVIYGPGDPGNILRMIKAVKKGYFFLPVPPTIKKSYGYIYGLLDSIGYSMSLPDKIFTYNYVEKETENLGNMIQIMNQTLGFKGKIIRIPFSLLKFCASIIYRIQPKMNGIHPDRVKKVARPTHIVPQVLMERNFDFQYDLKSSLLHWKQISPQDFE